MVGRKQAVMFGAVSRGDKPLWPRLSRSLQNFCNSLARAGSPLDTSLTSLIESGFHPSDDRGSGDDDSRERTEAKARTDIHDALHETQSHLDSIRRALPADTNPSRVPYLHLVLLKARLALLSKIGREHLLEDGISLPADLSPKMEAEGLYMWKDPENRQPLPNKNRQLLELWEELAR